MSRLENRIGRVGPRWKWGSRFIGLFILLLTVILSSQPATVRSQQAQHIALYLIVDSSGSMTGSDPLNLRWTAVRLLASLLDDGDELAVLAFNTNVTPFRGSTGYGPLIRIGRDVDKPTLLADLERFAASTLPDGYTDMLAAFKEVGPLTYQARTDSRPYIIFLTDGAPDLPNGLPNQYKEDMVQQVGQLDAPLYAGGLWPAGACQFPNPEETENQKLLQQLVNATPQGQTQCIEEADELPAFFLESFGRIADRYYSPLQTGRFEVRDDQVGIIQRLTFIYVENDIGCRNASEPTLCTPIYDPAGRLLTPTEIDGRADLQASFDDDFITLSIDNPEAGTWLVKGDSAHAIVQTRLRMEIAAPADNISRQAVGQRLPIQVRFFQEISDPAEEQPLPKGYTPTFQKQDLQLLDPPDQTKPTPIELVYNPDEDRYEARTSPLDVKGVYQVSLEAEVGGFRIVKEQRVQVEPFPSLMLEGIPEDGLIPLGPNQPVVFSLTPYLDGQVEPITELKTEYIKLMCNGQPVEEVRFRELIGDRYDLSFIPLQQDFSQCELIIEGIVKHIGTPYHLSFGPVEFEVQLITPSPTPTPAVVPPPTVTPTPTPDPSLTHNIPDSQYRLPEFSDWSDEMAIIEFVLEADQLPEEAILHIAIIDEAGQPVSGLDGLLTPTIIPVAGKRTYHLHLWRNEEPDPWPPEWLNPRPVTFTVKMSTLLDVPILPGDTFEVTGTRRSQLGIWRSRLDENWLRLVGLVLLLLASGVLLWYVWIQGWRILRSRKRTVPLETVTLNQLGADGQILNSRLVALSQFYELRHKLFGVRFGSDNVDISWPPFRPLPAEAYWRWKLRASQIDVYHNGEDEIFFEIYAQPGPDGTGLDADDEELDVSLFEDHYWLVNRSEEDLKICASWNAVSFDVVPGLAQPLTAGNLISTGDDSNVQFGGETPQPAPPPRVLLEPAPLPHNQGGGRPEF